MSAEEIVAEPSAADGPGTVVITGGTSGVGRATARAFAEAGHPVVVLARGQDALDATEAELRERHPACRAMSLDVTDRDALDRAADVIEAEIGPIEVWVNSAMVTVLGEFEKVSPEDFDRVMDVVFTGTVNGTRTALRVMRPRGTGRIVQVGSALAYRGIPLQAAYCAAKHAVQGFSDSLRSELLHQDSKITVSEVNLPAVNTPQFDMCRNLVGEAPQPVPPIFQPEVPARAVLHAARTGDRSLLVTSTTTRTVMGDRLVPGALDHLLASTGYDGQVSDRPAPKGDNLWKPLPGDHGCHGSFDDRARTSSLQETLRATPLDTVVRTVAGLGRRVGGQVLRLVV
ncbi:SDR family oxidoreductase [Nocardioides sp. zg-ZUI104]|uniref:SDR family oxidoreductase n=1 Tax=Nocardioides faecalis TaxID=2803858 RepID=UPI001BD0854A|nr:SDR family oxidoreductase [Nocardioides faecalis]MBS4752089.1 SDR family oxidoreductase [Nocardioides faecalis]